MTAKLWLLLFLIGMFLGSRVYSEDIPKGICSTSDNILIQAAGSSPIYLLRNGKKYYIETADWITRNGYDPKDIHVIEPSEVLAIPSGIRLTDQSPIPGTPAALNEKLIAGRDGKVYVVSEGERHWILDGRWIGHSRYSGQSPIPVSEAELQAIPLGVTFNYSTPEEVFHAVGVTGISFLFCGAFFLLATRRFEPIPSLSLPYIPILLFLGFGLLIAFREPFLLAHPRFWAEEGNIWFQYGLTHSLHQLLFFVSPTAGYFILSCNIGALLSVMTVRVFGLEYGPTASTLFALIVQLLPIGLILFGRSSLFTSLWKRVAGCAIVILASTTPDEIWLNTTNLSSFLGLTSLILLFEETWNWHKPLRWLSRGILVFCGLSSPYTIALFPLFVMAAFAGRQKEQRLQCVLLGICLVAQGGTAVRVQMEARKHGTDLHRGNDIRLDNSLINVFFGHMLPAAAGNFGRDYLLDKTGIASAYASASSFPPRRTPDSLRVAGCLCFLLITLTLWWLKGPNINSIPNMLIYAFVLLDGFICVTSFHSVPYGRYTFLPGMVFLWLLLADLESAEAASKGLIAMIILSYGLANGIATYRSVRAQSGPRWSDEVRIWQADHKYRLHIWPPTVTVNYDP